MTLYNDILSSKIFFILGPCVLDTQQNAELIAEKLVGIKNKYKVPVIFKSSFDKANRQSVESYRGIGFEESKKILKKIKEKYSLPLITDIHESSQAELVRDFADIIQIPAFLCRQTDLLIAAGRTDAVINIKKGQFISVEQLSDSVKKVYSTGNKKVMLTERGTFFGYGDLVVDFRNITKMAKLNVPIIFDATHSVQRPGGKGTSSGGEREFIKPLACASLEFGAKGIFMEVHPNPDKALCDGPNSLDLNMLDITISEIMKRVQEVHDV
ncbi:MAG: 3-deoxy-8-phosphooctulonate synthase [Proteobacteria bacterium]|nr:3-deoxy-8-phosphooctulonate synthase [Pseudomonadota bacterium]